MYKILSLIFIALFWITIDTTATTGNKTRFSAEITVGKNATHIGRITGDTLVVITGSTYSFTVDTPEDQGLVSIKTNVKELLSQITAKDGSAQQYKIVNKEGTVKNEGNIEAGDRLIVTSQDGKNNKTYTIAIKAMALGGQLRLVQEEITVNTTRALTLSFTAGQRSPRVSVQIYLPEGITATLDNTTVNVIGRGHVKLRDLATQSVGRVGSRYAYSSVGNVAITKAADRGSVLNFSGLDFRPANGPDLIIVIDNVNLAKIGKYPFKAIYTTAMPEVLTSAGIGAETATLTVTGTIADFERVADRGLRYKLNPDTYTQTNFKWSPIKNATNIQLMQSLDKGKSWTRSSATVDIKSATATVSGLEPNKLYMFRLSVKDGGNKGFSNAAYFYAGKHDIKSFGVTGDGQQDDTQHINEAIAYLNQLGGGTLVFSAGVYSVRTVHLKSNVYLYIEKDATIKALKGADAPEPTWFSDKKYRSGLSPTDTGPYEDPENYLTKQDVGHHYFRNVMFFGERLDNVKIIGNGLISGNGNLVTGDRVMNNAADSRADKMFTFKLCTNIEIGGLYREDDLWYDPAKDEPYYINKEGAAMADLSNMLNIDRAGHFVLLATGTDNLYVHDTYFGKQSGSNARDIYDFMGCNNVTATNIYSKVSSDDIIKLGSDCSLGFTRPASNYKVRNIIGDTNCNLFQIGSETADDIVDVHVDNIYITGANKAGFSISTNDGGQVKDIHLNCGHTGTVHSRSKMYRTTAPFFISISNRGRVLGAETDRFTFHENEKDRDELLVKNINIGAVENVSIKHIDVYEVYNGSSFNGTRWKPYDGTQKRATSIIAGYKLPEPETVKDGLNFKLPNGKHTGYIKNIEFDDVHILDKGGNPPSDTGNIPPELGVGQYNVANLKVQPSYGLWARHVMGLTVKACTFNYEKRDSRYAMLLDDVVGAQLSSIKMVLASDNDHIIKLKNSSDVIIENAVYFNDKWDNSPTPLPRIVHTAANGDISFPNRAPDNK